MKKEMKKETQVNLRFEFDNNKLLSDGLIKYDENKYRLSIPNGVYNVRIYAGDLNDDGDVNVYTHLNGEKKPPIWVNDRAICKADYLTTVENGELTIEFFGKYVCIQGIEITEQINEVATNLRATALVNSSKDKMVLLTFDCIDSRNGKNLEAGQYHLYKKDKNSGRDPEIITINERIYKDMDVSVCGEYEYYVKVCDKMGFEGKKGEKVEVFVADDTFVMPEVDFFKIKEQGTDYVTLSFMGDINAEKYVIYKKACYGNHKKIGELMAEVSENDSPIYTFKDTDVWTDREYEYSVEAWGLAGISKKYTVKSKVTAPKRERQLEKLDRGAIAVDTKDGIFIAWRLCKDEYMKKAAFNIYADGIKINDKVIDGATNYLHKEGTRDTIYEVRIIIDGVEEEKGYVFKPWAHNYMDIPIDKPAPYTTPDGHTYNYTANDASVADLDGDGEYEIVLKWDCNGKDNSHKGYSGIVYLDAYKLDGTKLWRINLGPNIRCGAHYTQFMVYDFDGDGYAEVIMKTADGTTDNAGTVIGIKDADYRNEDGFILKGDEYLTLFDGKYGTILDTVYYDPSRGTISEYGDSWGNRVDRFLACVAYLDGVHPSAVMCRGYYDHGRPTNLVAYDVKDKKLVKRWKFRADFSQNIEYTNQGFHNLAVADVDGDGCDEIVYGACVIDHDGTGLYSTGLEHGDAMHLGKFSPDTDGFDYFGIHEHADCPCGIEARRAGTGEITFGKFTGIDTGRGLTAKIDPRYRGNQMWAYYGAGLYNYDGTKISDESPKAINFAIWWDGDLLRELLDHDWYGYETCVGIPKIYKWDYEREELDIIMSTDNVLSNNGTKGNPCIQTSIFGDWREEVVFRGKDSTFLRVYTTTDYTEHRFFTFMHDYVYRLGVAWQNTAYNQPPHTSFYIGPDMDWSKVC